MRKIFIILLIFIAFITAQISFALPIPPEVKTIISFIYVQGKDGKLVPNGTGFFVGVKLAEKPDTFNVYLVTAKHVLQTEDKKSFFREVFIRLNKKDGNVEILRLPLIKEGKNKNVYLHEDLTVDLAVIPALPDQQQYDFKFLPDDFITTKEDFQKLKIREGSEVFFTGLFLPHIGEQKNYPIVRFGRVALITDEKIDWDGVKTELYLVETTSYGGNSGSPVFFYLGAEREPGSIIIGNPVLKLAGVMKGYFGLLQPVQFAETSKIPVVSSNIGIAGVIPAYKLHDILFSEELKRQRTLK